jgi:hypothetical protein
MSLKIVVWNTGTTAVLQRAQDSFDRTPVYGGVMVKIETRAASWWKMGTIQVKVVERMQPIRQPGFA